MPDFPTAMFAMRPWLLPELFPADLQRRLGDRVRLAPGGALTSFATEPARAALPSVEVLVTGWGCPRIDQEVLAAAPRLRAVVHAAGSVKEHVDPVVFAQGITVSSAAAANAVPVAEFTFASLIFAAKQAFLRARWFAHDRSAGDWLSGAGTGFYGRTVGVVGASRIGRLVLARLRSCDVRVLLADPFVSPAEAGELGVELVDVDELCRRSDLVSLHAPALPETRHLLDDRRLHLLSEGATIINTARGSLVDTEALTRHCASGRLCAILDVTDPEPLPADHPLLDLPHVLVTPHLAGAQGYELRRLGEFVLAEVTRLVQGDPLLGQVQVAELSRIA